jgi:UTP--glucose-1-phosphate uridylyltransferase
MYAYIFEGRRYDVGDKLGFLEATVEFALKREDLKIPFMKYLQTLKSNDSFSNLYDEVALTNEK